MQAKKNEIKEFLNRLSGINPDKFEKKFENPYSDEKFLQYYNLEKYLLFMQEYGPTVMFVGEAPGYKGCQLTGIPFVSEAELKNSAKYIWEKCLFLLS